MMMFIKLLQLFVLVAVTHLNYRMIEGREVVVMVHGFAGFGNDELGPVNYWNSNPSVIENFHPEFADSVFVASIGPFSSNWDRACELFAQIKGTRVDYGAAHSSRFGHERFGKDYTGQGFYPEWSASNRIHLIGHSMGGMTISMLEMLLQQGDQDEINAGSTSELFTGKGNWIKTITAISSPLDGTTLVDVLGDDLVDVVETIVAGVAGVSMGSQVENLYDFDLDHWGLGRQPGESFYSQFQRIKASPVLSSQDLSPFDLSVQGAYQMQSKRPQTYPGTYYFAVATEQTYSTYVCEPLKLRCGWVDKPEVDMWIILHSFAGSSIGMGGLDFPQNTRKNDGIVNYDSMRCPKLAYGGDSNCHEIKWNTEFSDGVWYWEKVKLDHLQVIGFSLIYALADNQVYRRIADRILDVSVPTYQTSRQGPSLDLQNNDDAAISPTGAIIMMSIGVVGALIGVAAVISVAKHRRNNANANANSHVRNNNNNISPFTSLEAMESQNPKFTQL